MVEHMLKTDVDLEIIVGKVYRKMKSSIVIPRTIYLNKYRETRNMGS
jgi:hypothetical protein